MICLKTETSVQLLTTVIKQKGTASMHMCACTHTHTHTHFIYFQPNTEILADDTHTHRHTYTDTHTDTHMPLKSMLLAKTGCAIWDKRILAPSIIFMSMILDV